MNRVLPETVARIGEAMAASAGGYLRNTVRLPGVTCEACSRPIDGYALCYKCNSYMRSGDRVADRVGTVVYASKHSASAPRDQTYIAMYGYKAPAPQLAHTRLVHSLAALGLAGHWDCVSSLSGPMTMRWTTVPGTRHAETEHPLHRMIASMFVDPRQEVPVRLRPGALKTRTLQSDHLEIDNPISGDTHVVVVDDSWVSGGSAQSVAIALKQAGAAEVSILALARVLDPSDVITAAFLRSEHARHNFAYTACPWTDGVCPTAR